MNRSPLKSKAYQSHTKLPRPVHQCWEEQSSQHLTVKASRDCIWEKQRADEDGNTLFLKGPHIDSLGHNSLTLSCNAEAVAQKTLGTDEEEIN